MNAAGKRETGNGKRTAGKRETGSGKRTDSASPRTTTTLDIHVQPRASQTEVVGWHGDAIKIRVTAPPVDGAANDALVLFLAEQLGVARSAVTVVGGATGRRKRVAIVGIERERVLEVLGVG